MQGRGYQLQETAAILLGLKEKGRSCYQSQGLMLPGGSRNGAEEPPGESRTQDPGRPVVTGTAEGGAHGELEQWGWGCPRGAGTVEMCISCCSRLAFYASAKCTILPFVEHAGIFLLMFPVPDAISFRFSSLSLWSLFNSGKLFLTSLLKTQIQLRKLKDLIGLIKRIYELRSPSSKIARSSVELQKWKGF